MKWIALVLLLPLAAFADTIVVDIDGGGNYTSIQEAVDNAGDGDRIYIMSGVYQENVIVPYPSLDIGFEGEDARTTIIDGGGVDKCLYFHFDGTGGDLTIKNLTFRNSGTDHTGGMSNSGLALRGNTDSYVMVLDCIFRDNPYHCIVTAADTRIDGNLFEDNLSSAVFLYGGGRSYVNNNTFIGCETGVYIASDASYPEVNRNIFYDLSVRGIWSDYPTSPVISCNDMWLVTTPYYGCSCSYNCFEADPLFCGNPPDGNYALRADSPCLDENNPNCIEVGAYLLGCDESAVAPLDWSTVKIRF